MLQNSPHQAPSGTFNFSLLELTLRRASLHTEFCTACLRVFAGLEILRTRITVPKGWARTPKPAANTLSRGAPTACSQQLLLDAPTLRASDTITYAIIA